MNFKKFEWRIFFRVIILFLILSGAAYLMVSKHYIYFFLTIPLIIYLVIDFIQFQKKTHEELNQFVEAVHYRDFSRYFNVKQAPAELQPL